jgi:hypothetical protein
MKPDVMIEVLESAAEQLGIKVSYEALQASVVTGGLRGGLCRVNKQWRVIVDRRAGDDERVQTLATALAGFDTSELELPAAARELLRVHARSGSARTAPNRAA